MKMKNILTLVCSVAIAGLAFGEECDDPFAPADPNAKPEPVRIVRTQMEYIEMSQVDLTKLLFLEKPESSDATALRKKAQTMIEKKEAKVIDTQLLVVESGNKSTSESTHEFVYPTEYENPPSAADIAKKIEETANAFPSNPATPTAFETRNLGSSLEAEITIRENNRLVDFRIISYYIWHTGDTAWQEWESEDGKPLTARMPNFYRVEMDTSGVSKSGQYTLLSVLSPKDAKGEVDPERKIMVFLKCDVMEVK